MRCPSLKELPDPPAGKTGWPWSEESPPLPERKPDGQLWPRISIVTPSYNQGEFIEETIRSVLLQGYPDLEYIVMDGGSTDGSVEIIKKYEPWLAYWVSEKDRGQSHAINKGMQRATGKIVAWLNSDDLYLKNALQVVAKEWNTEKEHWIAGKVKVGKSLSHSKTKTLTLSSTENHFEIMAFWLARELGLRTLTQPEVFVSRHAWQKAGGLFEKLSLTQDYHLWVKLAALGYTPTRLPCELAFFRFHPQQKTGPATQNYEIKKLSERGWGLLDAIRFARQKKVLSPASLKKVTNLFESKAGGYSRIIDIYYMNRGWPKLIASLILNSLVRPQSTLRFTPRSIIKECIKRKLNEPRNGQHSF